MKPKIELIHGDCLTEMKKIPDKSVDLVLTDPPYELGFMGKSWDNTGIAYRKDLWQEVLRVLKPGGHLLSFGGSRTYHRMACAIEDAGFEVRDMIEWVYGSGFPKSLNIGKAVDKLQGNERIPTGEIKHHAQKGVAIAEERGAIGGGAFGQAKDEEITKGTSEWEGWGTALKPAHEPIVLARKPLSEKTVAENALKWGVGGLNIDGCRVEIKEGDEKTKGGMTGNKSGRVGYMIKDEKSTFVSKIDNTCGRFPANFIHDGSQEVLELFPDTDCSGAAKTGRKNVSGKDYSNPNNIFGGGIGKKTGTLHNDSGSAARFFYCAKASKRERDRGCEGLEAKEWKDDGACIPERANRPFIKSRNNHPTVKPIALMSYLIKMASREGQTILDPFMGSGTTLVAAKELGRNAIGIEISPEYYEIAKKRINNTMESMF